MAHEDRPGEQRLVVYLMTDRRPVPTASALRRALGETLPDYMIPSTFVMLEKFPRTPGGKVDRQALPPPDRAHPGPPDNFTAPRDALEIQLAQIWCELFELPRAGIMTTSSIWAVTRYWPSGCWRR